MNDWLNKYMTEVQDLSVENLKLARGLWSLFYKVSEQISSYISIPELESIPSSFATIFQWNLDKRTLGFAFERNHEESGWYLADIRDGEEEIDSGLLSELTEEKLKELMIKTLNC